MRAILDWLEQRTGLPSAVRGFFDEDIPISSGWHQVFGSMALFCFLLQAVTGLLLAFNYAGTTTEAHSSIRFIMNEVTGGAIIRGLHHWGASAMIVVVGVHLLQVLLWGAYKAPREATWLSGLALLMITLAFGLTGYLLPWDNKAYWGTVVTAQITGNSPVLGPYLLRLLGAENGIGAVTFARFYAMHTMLLPLVITALIAGHLVLVRRHGVAPAPGDDGTRKKRFYPEQVLKDTVAIFGLFAALMFLAIAFTAPLGREADPTDTSFVPRPEWYFLFLFQALKFFEGPMEIIGSHVLPGLAMGALAVLPFLDRARLSSFRQRIPVAAVAVLVVATWGGLTRSAILSTPPKDRPFAEKGGPQDWQELQPAQLAGLAVVRNNDCTSCHSMAGRGALPDTPGGTRATDLAAVTAPRDAEARMASMRSHLPLELPQPQLDNVMSLLSHLDPLNAPGIVNAEKGVADGALVYQSQGCAVCHVIRGEGGQIGPRLDGTGSRHDRDWLRRHFLDPQSVVPNSLMPAFRLPDPEMEALLDYMGTL